MNKHPGGRPSMYMNTQEDLEQFKNATYTFLEVIVEDGVQFSMKRWADHLGISRQTLYNYRRRGEGWSRFMINTLCVYAILKTEATTHPERRTRPQDHYYQLDH